MKPQLNKPNGDVLIWSFDILDMCVQICSPTLLFVMVRKLFAYRSLKHYGVLPYLGAEN